MFGYSWGPILIILVIVLLLFGPKRLPDLAESIGKAIKSFKKAHEDPESLTQKPESEKGATSAGGKTCPACHKELPGDFAFCPHCGKDLRAA
jgi:sec-independent protein translocase protein TatA|uniref:Sec-independent protein translocase protein TatA n=1 Tax=Desulfobacca acetoxidans TaxID=60893 RepID=A0A7C5AL56_9BACT